MVRSVNTAAPSAPDWRTFLTIEDRQSVRAKIRAAFVANCKSFDDLLDTAVAIEEELLHISAPSRLDYLKNSFEYDSRVKLKRKQMGKSSGEAGKSSGEAAPDAASTGKRSRTEGE